MEWLGEVPEHWEVKRLEHVALYRTSSVDKKTEENELPVRLCNYTDVYYGDRIRVSQGEFMNATASTSEIQRFRLLVGDILVTKDSEDWRDIAVPAIVDETADDFVCGYHLGVIRSGPGIHPLFLYRALQSEAVNRQLQVSATGVTRYGLQNAAVGDVVLPIPPINEQRAISAFLDRETERIDSLVAKIGLLIERLGEYRTALITRTATRGLPPEPARIAGVDPSPRLKPSGMEWLGEVPEHWEVKRLSLIGSFFKGGGGTKEDEVENGVPCVRYGDIYTQHQYFIRETRSDISEESAAKYTSINYGDILFAGSGETIEEIGKSAANLIEGPAYCGGDVIVLRPVIESDATFLGYATDCSTSTYQKAFMGRGVTVMHIYGQELKRLLLPLPPIDEQRAIAAYLDRETERIDSLVAMMRLLIERLSEYRTALIAAAVTGKIDVRGSAESPEAHSRSQLP